MLFFVREHFHRGNIIRQVVFVQPCKTAHLQRHARQRYTGTSTLHRHVHATHARQRYTGKLTLHRHVNATQARQRYTGTSTLHRQVNATQARQRYTGP